MDKRQYFLIPYIKHWVRSRSKFDLHSPFVHKIYKDILRDRTTRAQYQIIESVRKKLLDDKRIILKTDLSPCDPGSAGIKKRLTISRIARDSSISPRYGQLLFRLVNHFRPRIILELGTSFGISTLYMAYGAPEAEIITIEGCPETLNIARKNFGESGVRKIRLVQGAFDEELPVILKNIPPPDLIFIDGNHRKEATLCYFKQCIQHRSRDSVFVFHDIYWSKGMEQSWKEIKSNPSVSVTLDLFQLGLVFFDDRLSKEDFIVRF